MPGRPPLDALPLRRHLRAGPKLRSRQPRPRRSGPLGASTRVRVFHLGGGVGGAEDALFRFKERFYEDGRKDAYIGKVVHDKSGYAALTGRGVGKPQASSPPTAARRNLREAREPKAFRADRAHAPAPRRDDSGVQRDPEPEARALARDGPSLRQDLLSDVPLRDRYRTAPVRLRRPDRVDAVLVDGKGDPVRTLASDLPRPRGRVTFLWNGRNEEGEVVPDGRYRLRVHLRQSRRTILIPTPVKVETDPPALRILRTTQPVLSPDGDRRHDRFSIFYRTDEQARPVLMVGGKRASGGRFSPPGGPDSIGMAES